MRRRYLRFDIWLSLLLAYLVSLGTSGIVNQILPEKYEEHKMEHQVEAGEIGGIADETVFRAQSVEDLLSHDTFTVVSPGIEYRNRGAGFYGSFYLQALTLPSGEIVAARINEESVVHENESIYDGDSTLPVGHIIKEELSEHKSFLEQITYKRPLSRTDFYIDMVGEAEIQSEESFVETPVMLIQLFTIFLTFPIFHALGARIGIFPYFFVPKRKQTLE